MAHVGAGHAGSGHFVAPHAVYARPTYHAAYGGRYYGGRSYYRPGYANYGYRHAYGYRYPYRNWAGYGLALGLGYPYYYGSYAYPYSGYAYSGYAYPDYGAYSAPDVIEPDTTVSAYPPVETGPAPATLGSARVTVQLPANAQLWIDGQLTNQTGSVRVFETPATLEPGRSYTYRLRAEWVENGQPVVRERAVNFQAGNEAVINLNIP